jgi:sugar phosphate isomerase/epimerase
MLKIGTSEERKHDVVQNQSALDEGGRPMKIGVGSYAFRWSVGTEDFVPSAPLTPLTFLEKSAACGAQVVQICDNMPLDELSNPDLEMIKQKALDMGLDLELGVRGNGRSYLKRNIDVCRQIGADLMRAVLDNAESIPQTIRMIQSLIGELHACDVKLAIENHFRFTPAELVQIIEAVDDAHVGVCLDPLNSISQLIGPAEVISTLAPYSLSVHAKDAVTFRQGTGFGITGCPVGDGMVDQHRMIALLREYRRSPNIVVEGWMDQQENEESTIAQEEDWVRQSLAYLRSIL